MFKIIGGDQKEYGPVSFDQLVAWVKDNRANGQTLVQREGGPWVPLGSLPEFASVLPAQTGTSGGGAGAGAAATGATGMNPGTPAGGFGGGGMGYSGGPMFGGPEGGDGGRARALEMVQGPATGLLVMGILFVLLAILGVVGNLFGAQFQPPPGEMPPELRQFFDAMRNMQGPMAVVSSLIGLAISGLLIYAASKLRSLESFTLVVTATILGMVPCTSPCCCIGLPVGIWVLVVLFKPEVKSMFR